MTFFVVQGMEGGVPLGAQCDLWMWY